jgi:hypothetical protein
MTGKQPADFQVYLNEKEVDQFIQASSERTETLSKIIDNYYSVDHEDPKTDWNHFEKLANMISIAQLDVMFMAIKNAKGRKIFNTEDRKVFLAHIDSLIETIENFDNLVEKISKGETL